MLICMDLRNPDLAGIEFGFHNLENSLIRSQRAAQSFVFES